MSVFSYMSKSKSTEGLVKPPCAFLLVILRIIGIIIIISLLWIQIKTLKYMSVYSKTIKMSSKK